MMSDDLTIGAGYDYRAPGDGGSMFLCRGETVIPPFEGTRVPIVFRVGEREVLRLTAAGEAWLYGKAMGSLILDGIHCGPDEGLRDFMHAFLTYSVSGIEDYWLHARPVGSDATIAVRSGVGAHGARDGSIVFKDRDEREVVAFTPEGPTVGGEPCSDVRSIVLALKRWAWPEA